MRWVAPVLLIIIFAGCLAPAGTIESASVSALAVEGATSEGDVARWNGTSLAAPRNAETVARAAACWVEVPTCEEPLVPCTESTCERRAFEITGPAGAIVLSVRWPTGPAQFDAWIEDPSGAVLASAPHRYLNPFGLVARVEAPTPGAYAAVVAIRDFESEYEAALRIEPTPVDGEARALLPNLITLPPTDLTLDTPDYVGASYFAFPVPVVREAMEATGHQGCRADEAAEYGAKRCLRFSNSVANIGEGPLDVSLDAGSMAFTQHVHSSDGSVETHPGGAAEWHATHAHWHNAANNLFTVRPYDVETRTMGASLGEGKKGGICFADVGIADVGLHHMLPAAETGWNCFKPREAERDWRMGITPGWYDMYPLILSDQYVDITGVEDGTYALCSITNGEGTLLETDTSDNEACTTFALTDETIELLEPAPYHAMR